MSGLTAEEQLEQLTLSRDILQSITGLKITQLCYPYGQYTNETLSIAPEVGYLCGVTTKEGFASASQGFFELKRFGVATGCDAAWLKNLLAPLGY